jgi:DNA-binding transcriptional MerR regulator
MAVDTYSVSQVAKIVGIAPNTVRDWTRKFELDVQAEEDTERRYTSEHVAIFRTVKVLRDQGEPMKRVKPRIAQGERLEPPKPSPDTPEPPPDGPSQETALVSQAQAEVARYRGKIEAVEDERDRLVKQLADAQAAHLVAIERAAAAEAKLEQIEQKAVISVVHSLDGKPPPEGEKKPPAWQFWRRG